MLKDSGLALAPALALAALLSACGDDTIHLAPECDAIGWPLGLDPHLAPSATEYAVECAEGWANAVDTREAVDTLAFPGSSFFFVRASEDHGLLVNVHDAHAESWDGWLQRWDVDAEHGLLVFLEADAETPRWVRTDIVVWSAEFVDGWVWALVYDASDLRSLLQLDPATGETVAARPWDDGESFNWMYPARGEAGAWIAAYVERDSGEVDQTLYRATSLDDLGAFAQRTSPALTQLPFGYVEILADGGAAWKPKATGFEVFGPDGEVRWSRPEGVPAASDADSMIVVRSVPTGVGAGQAVQFEKVALADGATIWEREHQRFEVVEPERCGAEGCALVDRGFPRLRPDGGYVVYGRHAYPSTTCSGQPFVLAVSAEGEAEWAHRIDVCGWTGGMEVFADGHFVVFGLSANAEGDWPLGAWLRRFAAP